MPESEPPCFAIVCDGDMLERHLVVCANSDFHIVRDRVLGLIRVHDRDTVLLDAVKVAGGWLVRLHTAYYRHPFEYSDGTAPPGVP